MFCFCIAAIVMCNTWLFKQEIVKMLRVWKMEGQIDDGFHRHYYERQNHTNVDTLPS